MKTKTMKLTGGDPVSGGGKVADVTDWLLTKLADIHSRANQIVNDYLATLLGAGNS